MEAQKQIEELKEENKKLKGFFNFWNNQNLSCISATNLKKINVNLIEEIRQLKEEKEKLDVLFVKKTKGMNALFMDYLKLKESTHQWKTQCQEVERRELENGVILMEQIKKLKEEKGRLWVDEEGATHRVVKEAYSDEE